jgi:hypothetical protein
VSKHSDAPTEAATPLDEKQAIKLVRKSNLKRQVLLNMTRALSFHPWRNTPEENARLYAAKRLLEKKR